MQYADCRGFIELCSRGKQQCIVAYHLLGDEFLQELTLGVNGRFIAIPVEHLHFLRPLFGGTFVKPLHTHGLVIHLKAIPVNEITVRERSLHCCGLNGCCGVKAEILHFNCLAGLAVFKREYDETLEEVERFQHIGLA